MKKHVFYIVDVFAEKKYSGNQLAVIGDAHDLSSESMQEISREMNYSETTFITALHQSESNFDVRIFTPAEEVPFAGHPTLGTAFIIQTEILKKPVDILHLNLKVGRIPVTFEYSGGKAERLWMKQNAPVFSQRLDIASIAKILNLKTDQIDSRFPIEEVSTGLPFIIVPLKNLQAVRRSSIQKDKFFDLIRNTAAKAILVFSPECYDPQNHLNVRVFVDYYGIPEDPATGSANGCLAAYLVKHSYFSQKSIDLRIEQGMEIARPSILYARAALEKSEIHVQIGGKVIPVAEGFLL